MDKTGIIAGYRADVGGLLDRVIRQLSEFGLPTVSIVLSSRRQALRRLRRAQ
jgi:hypothetical protein